MRGSACSSPVLRAHFVFILRKTQKSIIPLETYTTVEVFAIPPNELRCIETTMPSSSLSPFPTRFGPSVAETGGTVHVHALSAGHLTIPEEQFVSPCAEGARKTVPSLCFLIQHTRPGTNKTTRIVFDLGLRRDVNRYAAPIQRHIQTRQPMTTDPDVVKSLRKGGLSADDIDYVIYSHVGNLIRHEHSYTPKTRSSNVTNRYTGTTLASPETLSAANSWSAVVHWTCFLETRPTSEAATHSLSQTYSIVQEQLSFQALTLKVAPNIWVKTARTASSDRGGHSAISPGQLTCSGTVACT